MSEGVPRDTQEGAGSTTATLRCGSPSCPASSSGASGRRWGSFLPMALLNPLHPPHRSYQEGSASCAISPAGCCLSSGSQDTNVLFMITSQPRSRRASSAPGGPALPGEPHKTAGFEDQGLGVSVFMSFPVIPGAFTVSE